MKAIITIPALLITQLLFGQVKTGTYDIIPDTVTETSKLFGRNFSQLILKKDNAFTYKYLTTLSCFLWYDCEGKWRERKDTLILADTVMSFHYPVTFTRWKMTDDKRIVLSVRSKLNKPIPGAKVLLVFKASADSVTIYTDAEGMAVVSTENRKTLRTNLNEPVDDVELFVECMSIKYNQLLELNTFGGLSEEIDCVVDEDAKSELTVRTTFYKIEGTRLVFINQHFDKPDASPGRHLFGNFAFAKE